MRKLTLVALLALTVLDGTAWTLRQRGAMGSLLFWMTDDLTFADGRFASKISEKKGFSPVAYEAKQEGDRLLWTAIQTNAEGERMEWTGSVSGSRMKGKFTWVHKNGNRKSYRWKARKT